MQRHTRLIAAACLIAVTQLAPGQTPTAADKKKADDKRQIGQMVLDGIPPVDEGLRERMLQYLEVRPTNLTDVSDDGQALIVSTRFGNTNQLHVVSTPMGMRKQITFFDEPVNGGTFIPGSNGRNALFGKDKGGDEKSQYYILDLDSGRWTLLTDGKSRHASPSVSKSGRYLAYTGTARNEKDFDLYLIDLHASLPRVVSGDKEPGKGDIVMKSADGQMSIRGTVTAEGGATPPAEVAADVKKTMVAAAAAPGEAERKRIWEVEGQYYAGEFTKDDSKLLVQRYISERETQWFIFDIAGSKPTPITPPSPPFFYGDATWAHDNKGVYMTTDRDGEFRKLYRLNLEYGDMKCLTSGIEWDIESVAVDPAGKGIAFIVNENGVYRLYFADEWGNGGRRIEGLPDGVIGSMRFADKGGVLGFTVNSSKSPADAYTLTFPEGKLTRWTAGEVGGLNPETFIEPQWIYYPTFDQEPVAAGAPAGRDAKPRMIPALYYKARGSGPRPVVINPHGGPEGQTLPAFSNTYQFWANELGISVIAPNVRGSTGYGRTFHQIDNGVQREDAVKDIGALLDWIGKQPELDSKRIGIYGGSYGGYMVLGSLVNYPDRFKAGIDIVGIASFITFLETTPEYRRDLRREEYGDERKPEVRAVLEKISPLGQAEKIKAALFVAHGKNDPRVPYTEAELIVKKMRDLGRPVWYALALDEGHGFGKKPNRDLASVLYAAFWQEHLLK